jgi:hypothetical protein
MDISCKEKIVRLEKIVGKAFGMLLYGTGLAAIIINPTAYLSSILIGVGAAMYCFFDE